MTVVLLVTASIAVAGLGAAASPVQEQNAQQSTPEAENATAAPFDIQTGNVIVCGLTCRQVDVALTNQANETASNITVESDIMAGQEVVAQREAQIDSLKPNETVMRTIRVSVGLQELSDIRQSDGTITVETEVTSDQYNQTFASERQVG